MRRRRRIAILAIALAVLAAHRGYAQSGGAQNQSDQTLEIAPRIAPSPPKPAPTPEAANDDAAQPAGAASTPPAAAHPYLGISVETIYSNDWSSHGGPVSLVKGLEVVSVDPNSPAAIAGLRGHTGMSSVGESTTTFSALVPPLQLLTGPLLKKSGALGQNGDLIVAIDDQPVTSEMDLQAELEKLNPGDTIYFSVVRAGAEGSYSTLKLPIKLGDASQAAFSASDPIAPRTPLPAKHP